MEGLKSPLCVPMKAYGESKYSLQLFLGLMLSLAFYACEQVVQWIFRSNFQPMPVQHLANALSHTSYGLALCPSLQAWMHTHPRSLGQGLNFTSLHTKLIPKGK